MIFRLESSPSRDLALAQRPAPAWSAVEKIQRSSFDTYCLVTQPYHARISGQIAAHLDTTRVPDLTPDIVEAIALHDHGWSQFESDAPQCLRPLTDPSGRPLSFLDASPEFFLKAWSASIEAVSSTGPTGEFIVTQHFRALAERRLRSVVDPPESTRRITDFATYHREREQQLLSQSRLSAASLSRLVKLLQFCDLLSLVLCSAAPGTLDFADDFCLGPLRLAPVLDGLQLQPSPLASPVRIQIPAFLFRDGQLTPQAESTLLLS